VNGQRVRYEDILSGLDDALGFARDLGLKSLAKHGRFSHYRKKIDELISTVIRRDLSSEVAKRIRARLRDYLVALSESFELSDVMAHLKSLPPQVLGPKLKIALKGPTLPTQENTNSNNARNVLFELSVAARLKNAGIEPTLGEHPDVSCYVADKPVFIECKRPFAEATLGENIESAANQLLTHLATDGKAVGIIAISVSKALNPGFQPIRTPDAARARAWLVGALESAAASVGSICAKFDDGRIVGILFHAIAVFENVETNRYDVGQQFLAYPFILPADPAYLSVGKALDKTSY